MPAMSRWFVGSSRKQQVRFEGQRERQCRTLALAPRGTRRIDGAVEPETGRKLDQPRLGPPALPIVADVLQSAAPPERLEQGVGWRELGFLLDRDDAQTVTALHGAVIERGAPRKHPQER